MTKFKDISDNVLDYTDLLEKLGGRYPFESRLGRGVYQRLTRGKYMRTRYWAQLTEEEQYLARIIGLADTLPGAIFSHQTAALIHGLPTSGVPEYVHLYVPHRVRSQGLRIHHGRLHMPTETTVFLPGIRVTSLERTLEDLALAHDKKPGIWVKL